MSVVGKCIKARIADGAALIERLEPVVAQARADSQAAAHDLNVQLRYGRQIVNATRKPNAFDIAIAALIDADKAAVAAIGKGEDEA